LLDLARDLRPDVCAIVLAADAAGPAAVEALRRGAYDVQAKPVRPDRLLATLRLGLAPQRLAARVGEMEGQLDLRFGLETLAGRSRAAQRVQDQVRQVAATRASVLLEGERGAGKSVIARAIHQHSPRRERRFERLGCGGAEAAALEAELFGSDAADPPRPGRLALADGGTLFLEDVDRAPPAVQVRLLRFLQERVFEPVGGMRVRRADVRVLASTERDLAAEARAGRFREDLYWLLAVVRIAVPPLRERREDVPLLVERLVREANREHGRRVPGVTPGVLERLVAHDWPGNVRELKSVIEGMIATARGRRPLDVSALPDALRGAPSPSGRLEVSVGMTVDEVERLLVAATLRHAGGDKRRAAAMLGIGLRTLYRKIGRYGLA
ncbi:MAG TPA: sigma-54 dependent transcriptional regulator, partial [Candidatus Eisenbacteria bacterium]|nr:sigma-54 dependent transcriptional regulator [Candidatus Eisenbacteria bacterium]